MVVYNERCINKPSSNKYGSGGDDDEDNNCMEDYQSKDCIMCGGTGQGLTIVPVPHVQILDS